MAYTDEQIKAVCDKATEVLHGYTDAQNVTFPTRSIIAGMKANLDINVIADNARAEIEGLPMFNNGTYNTVGSNLNLFNLASYMRGAVYRALEELQSATPTPTPTEEPTTPEPTPTPTPTEEPTTPDPTPEDPTPTEEPTPTPTPTE